jgi:uncharacterized protein
VTPPIGRCARTTAQGVELLDTRPRGEEAVTLHLTTVMLAVEDLERSKAFYAQGLGCTVTADHPGFTALDLGDGSSSLALYPREAAAGDAGVPADGSGFRGVSFHHIVDTSDAVDEVMAQAVAAGGTVVKEADKAGWGGYFGYFADPDGYLWKVATNS